jgi:cytidylate kinase
MIITISREYGSGGAEIAHKLAERLGVPCYDKSVAQLTAATSEFSKESIEEAEDRVSGMFEYATGTYTASTLPLYDRIYLAQRETLIALARAGNCVLVGRCAANILEEADIPSFNVFIYAPMEIRKKRIAERHGVDLKKAEKLIRRRDEFRRSYYKRYAYSDWGNKSNYDLLINSKSGIDRAVEIICAAVGAK